MRSNVWSFKGWSIFKLGNAQSLDSRQPISRQDTYQRRRRVLGASCAREWRRVKVFMWGGLLWFREMLPRPPLLSCGMMLHLSLKKFPCLSSSPMFHDRSNREQPGDHVNYNVGDIQPVPCVWIQSTFRFLFKTVQNRNQVWGSRFCWQQRSLRNK